MAIIIVPLEAADRPALHTLLQQNSLPLDGLDDWPESTLIARDGARVVGSAALELYGTEALLRSVAVDASLRGQGLGQQLTSAALEAARQRGVTAVYLLTETAAAFFPRFGFAATPRAQVPASVQQSVEFTSACPQSALVMRLAL